MQNSTSAIDRLRRRIAKLDADSPSLVSDWGRRRSHVADVANDDRQGDVLAAARCGDRGGERQFLLWLPFLVGLETRTERCDVEDCDRVLAAYPLLLSVLKFLFN